MLQLVRDGVQRVGNLAHFNGVEDLVYRVQLLARKLETVVPEQTLVGGQLLALLPGLDSRRIARAAFHVVEQRRAPLGQGWTRRRVVTDDQLVLAVRVLVVVEDAFLLHQPASEVFIRLLILHAEIARLVRTGQLKRQVGDRTLQHLLEDGGLRCC